MFAGLNFLHTNLLAPIPVPSPAPAPAPSPACQQGQLEWEISPTGEVDKGKNWQKILSYFSVEA